MFLNLEMFLSIQDIRILMFFQLCAQMWLTAMLLHVPIISMSELSCAKLRPAYTSYSLVFGQLACAEDVYYVQLCLLKWAAAEKKLSWVGVGMIKSTTTKKYNFLGRAELHSGSTSVIREAFIRKQGLCQDLKWFTTYISLELGKNIFLKISLEIRNFPRSREIFLFYF